MLNEHLIKNKKAKHYIEIHSRTIKVRDATESGFWRVVGEHPDGDARREHPPLIGIYEGTFYEVLEVVIKNPKFFTWGFGGEIQSLKRGTFFEKTPQKFDGKTLLEDTCRLSMHCN